jgi:hypothetical protein
MYFSALYISSIVLDDETPTLFIHSIAKNTYLTLHFYNNFARNLYPTQILDYLI